MPALWRDLAREEQRALSTRFIHLEPTAIESLSDDDFYLFAQWVYGKEYNRMATSVAIVGGGAEFIFDLGEDQHELLRVSPGRHVPPDLLYHMLQSAKAGSFQKMRVYLRAPKSEAIRRLQLEFPLAFEAVDLDGLKSRLAHIRRIKAGKSHWSPTDSPFRPRAPAGRSLEQQARREPLRWFEAPDRRRKLLDVFLLLLILVALSFGVLIVVERLGAFGN